MADPNVKSIPNKGVNFWPIYRVFKHEFFDKKIRFLIEKKEVGYNVTDTMRKGVVDIEVYVNGSTPKIFLAGQVSVLGGCSVWLIVATLLKLPVSTTQSIVGATLGFSLVVKWLDGIRWVEVLKIVASWCGDSIKSGLRALPFFYFFCIAFNTFAITYQGSKVIHLSSVPLWLAFVLSIGLGLLTAVLIHFIGKPIIIKWLDKKPQSTAGENSSSCSEFDSVRSSQINVSCAKETLSMSSIEILASDLPIKEAEIDKDNVSSNKIKTIISNLSDVPRKILPDKNRVEDPKTLKLFSVLQVFTACFAGFAHGANDVSNAVAPLTAIWLVYQNAEIQAVDKETPIYLLLYGVLAICVGLTVLGHRVIRTVGQDMSEVHPASGFTIEFGAAVTVLIASKIGLPISTTHCLVGSVVSVGMIKSGRGVDWRLFRNIAFSWVVTLPVSGLIAAGMMAIFKIFL
uniref:Phosphate transporter n=1 Tax=Acrobeloides nanus TaxID=290746 RepID=A0A914EIF7_9BILA